MGSFVTDHHITLSSHWSRVRTYNATSLLSHDDAWIFSPKLSKRTLDNDENGRFWLPDIVDNSFLKQTQLIFHSVWFQIPEMTYILAILAIIIIFYAWFGVVIFYNSEQGTTSFPNLIEGVW